MSFTSPEQITVTDESENDDTAVDVTVEIEHPSFEPLRRGNHGAALEDLTGCSGDTVEDYDDGSGVVYATQDGTFGFGIVLQALRRGYVPSFVFVDREHGEGDGVVAMRFREMYTDDARQLAEELEHGIKTAVGRERVIGDVDGHVEAVNEAFRSDNDEVRAPENHRSGADVEVRLAASNGLATRNEMRRLDNAGYDVIRVYPDDGVPVLQLRKRAE